MSKKCGECDHEFCGDTIRRSNNETTCKDDETCCKCQLGKMWKMAEKRLRTGYYSRSNCPKCKHGYCGKKVDDYSDAGGWNCGEGQETKAYCCNCWSVNFYEFFGFKK